MKKSDAIKLSIAVAALVVAAVVVYLSVRTEPPPPIEPAPQTPDSVIPPREGGGIKAPGVK